MPPSPIETAPLVHSASTTSVLDEETARAEIYGVLSQLFYAPASPETLAALRVSVTEAPVAGGFLEEPWRALVGAARSGTDAAIADEYEALFGGVGKPEVYLYASHYLSGFLNEKPLASLRTVLAELGLTRTEAMPETEDHFAYLCEVMRYLIAGEDVAVSNLTQQRAFFLQQLQPWVMRMCEAVSSHPKASFYSVLAQFAQAFLEVETQGFDLLE